jgi:hypothetical protein
MSERPQLIFPNGITTTQARRLADIGDALVDGGLNVGALVDASVYDFTPAEKCDYCGWEIEAGHCYTCRPVFGYGEGRSPKPGSRALKGERRDG